MIMSPEKHCVELLLYRPGLIYRFLDALLDTDTSKGDVNVTEVVVGASVVVWVLPRVALL